jgi:hypothetical protein
MKTDGTLLRCLGPLIVVCLAGGCGLFERESSLPRATAFEEKMPSGAVLVEVDSEGPSRNELVRHAPTHAFVAWFGVGAPLGRVVLMRRGTELCAIRFTTFNTREETHEGLFTLGGPSYYAEYDWYDLSEHRKRSGHRETSRKPGYGIPLLTPPMFFAGNPFIGCGSMEPLWWYPIAVRFHETGDVGRDHGIELAPTGWKDAGAIDLAHPSLRWYGVNERRKPFFIPLELLPQ